MQGAHALPKEGGEYLAITKSLKDVACLYSCGITAIAPISENCFVTEAQFERLSKKFKKIILFYDNDSAGITHMNKFRKQFPDVMCYESPVILARKIFLTIIRSMVGKKH